ncbi:hypothetical protein LA080_000127 [Diaporthe eres]|nr:hypothetical protein LA080_000127 [Diaporthe eres]
MQGAQSSSAARTRTRTHTTNTPPRTKPDLDLLHGLLATIPLAMNMLGALLNRESRAIGHRPAGPSAQGPQARRRPGKAFPSRCTETTPRELVKTPIGIDDPLSSPAGFFITKRKTLQDRVAQQINQASFFDFRYADRLAPVGRLKRGHMMNRLRFERRAAASPAVILTTSSRAMIGPALLQSLLHCMFAND